MATSEEMDRMYRLQRYFYDITRKYYLLGRDRLLREMDLAPDARVLEIGCGTARNLICLARQRPQVQRPPARIELRQRTRIHPTLKNLLEGGAHVDRPAYQGRSINLP